MPKPSLQTTVTAKSTTTVDLSVRLTKKLRAEIAAYTALKTQMAALKEVMEAHKANIGEIREATGEQSIKFEGATLTEVRGTSSYLDTKQMLNDGVITAAQLVDYTKSKPKKPYEKITLAGEKDYGE